MTAGFENRSKIIGGKTSRARKQDNNALSRKLPLFSCLLTHCCPVKIRNGIKKAYPFNSGGFEMSLKNKAPFI
jgi:hypothetical protein